jgi:hypothetical protein
MDQSITAMLDGITPVNRSAAMQLWDDLQAYLPNAPGSTKSHHAWNGGYVDHVQECMNLARILYERLNTERTLPFTLASAYVVLFLHDCEKPFRHATDAEFAHFPWIAKRPTKSDKVFQKLLLQHYGFIISDDEQNALHYVEGEKNDYKEGSRVQGPLAAFCHSCDALSARLWYDYPRREHA